METKFTTTFWMDFSIADRFGAHAIRDTYKRAFRAWKSDVRYLTDLVLTLNHKLWQWYEAGNMTYAEVYDELWREADAYAAENLTGDDARYYFEMTD